MNLDLDFYRGGTHDLMDPNRLYHGRSHDVMVGLMDICHG